MKLSLNWLRDYAPFPDDDQLIADTLNGLGIAVERRPPRRRRLRRGHRPGGARRAAPRCGQGDPGLGRQAATAIEHHVWCGASNFAPGDVVPLATVGTAMPDGRTIGSRGILGIPSDGMLCSAHELGLGSDHSGILVLPSDAPLGVPYGDVTGLVDDVVFDVDVTRNRPDAFGHVGVARDLAAKLGLPFTPPRPASPPVGSPADATVEIVAGERCGRFTLTVLSGDRRRPERPVDGRPAGGRRSATDQQRRRRQQLRDARAQPAEPRLRPGDPRWGRDPSALGHRRRGS